MAKKLIDEGSLKTWSDLVVFIGPTPLMKFFGSNTSTVRSRIKRPGLARLQEIDGVAEFLQVSKESISELFYSQMAENKKKLKGK